MVIFYGQRIGGSMSALRLLVAGVVCVAVAVGAEGAALAATPAATGTGAPALGNPLVVPAEQALVGGEQVAAQRESMRMNPLTVDERVASATSYQGLSNGAAERLARRQYPILIGNSAGGPPPLRTGQKLLGFPTDNAMLVLDKGQRAVVESIEPLALETSRGKRTPIDLSLTSTRGGFQPRLPVVHMHIPKRLADGTTLTSAGVSLTPVDKHGAALVGAEGAIQGATVFFGDTESPQTGALDMDSLVKPDTNGFRMETLLRSRRSPQQLFFKVGLPGGATLAESSPGAVRVVEKGKAVALITAPDAHDAEGTAIPVHMSVSGDMLTLKVHHRQNGAYRYPILVDPEDELLTGSTKPTNWKFCANDDLTCEGHSSGKFKSTGWGGAGGLTNEPNGTYAKGEWVSLSYETQGESTIREMTGEISETNPSGNIEGVLQLANSEKVEGTYPLAIPPATGYTGSAFVCPKVGEEFVCVGEHSQPKNRVSFEQTAKEPGAVFKATLSKARVELTQKHVPEYGYNSTSPTLAGGRENVLFGAGGWLSPSNGALELWAKDPGIGVSYFSAAIGGWSLNDEFFEKGQCSGFQCFPTFNETITYHTGMVDGTYRIEILAKNALGSWGTGTEPTVKVDGTAPSGFTLTGLPAGGELNGQNYGLRAQATDGSGTTASSGVKSVALTVDGQELLGSPSSTCSPGPCVAGGEWTLNGEGLGAGPHVLTIVATDYAGNIGTKEYPFTVRHASPLSVGPGAVDPTTGALNLSATDVSISAGQRKLTVARSYNSRQLTAGTEGSLGPQWSINTGTEERLEKSLLGGMVLVGANGGATMFWSDGKGGYESPQGDSNLVLSQVKEGEVVKEFLLKDSALGTTIHFTLPEGSTGLAWLPHIAEGVAATSTETYNFQIVTVEGKKITEPTEELAPVPSGVSCSPTLKAGCRALTFVYATSTSATGEGPEQWGNYNGRLKEILFHAYDPVSKAMQEPAVAKYVYDSKGRLRAEWDPRISPELKNTYGYDAEGHVVAINRSGMQPWILHYGNLAGDTLTGRLLSVIRPSASTKIESNPAPTNTAAPTLSNTSPVVGTTLSVATNGSWSNTPLSYSYQWQDCDSTGKNCVAITGAVNQTYTPQARDAGYTLIAQVTATNNDGLATASTAASKVIALTGPSFQRTFGSAGTETGQFKTPLGDAIDAQGNVWVSDSANLRYQVFTATGGSPVAHILLTTPAGIAINHENGNVYISEQKESKIHEFNEKAEVVATFGKEGSGAGQLKTPVGLAVDSQGNVWVADKANNRIEKFSSAGVFMATYGSEGVGNGQFKSPVGVAVCGEGVYVTDQGNNRVQELSLSGAYVRQFGSAGTENGKFTAPSGIATDPLSGNLYVVDRGNNRVEAFNPAGTFLFAFGSAGTENGKFTAPEAIAVNASGDVYVVDTGNNRVEEFSHGFSTNNPPPAPQNAGTSAVNTIDYRVTVSGAGAPYALGKTEVKQWDQEDDPTEATALFPPDSPQGWPAESYTRATISYLDPVGHIVNVAEPSGRISTNEYNSTNDMVRSLTAANRAIVLKEAEPEKAARVLDSQNTYNAEGTELTVSVGPQHEVKASAKAPEVLSRKTVNYSYDEGAPAEGGPYRLLTKTIEHNVSPEPDRITVKSYSGQEGLGWKLRKPTSVTTDPGGLNLTTTTAYDPVTGNVVETRSPGAGHTQSTPSYQLQAGAWESQEWQLSHPQGVGVDKEGHIWITDSNLGKLEEFNPNGDFIRSCGSKGTGNGQFKEPAAVAFDSKGNMWVADFQNSRIQELNANCEYIKQVGTYGTGPGQFERPAGIGFDTSHNIWVTDYYDNRIEKFNENGEYLAQIAEAGAGNGQLLNPYGIAFDSLGNAWVADSYNKRVEEFNSSGAYVKQISGESHKFNRARAISIGASNHLWIVGETSTVELESSGTELREVVAHNGGETESWGLAVDTSSHVWIAREPKGSGKESVVEEFSETGEYLGELGDEGRNVGQLKGPQGVAVDSKGNAWVADSENYRIQEFNSEGGVVRQFGSFGTGNGQFKGFGGITVDSKGNVWVTDLPDNRVEEFSEVGAYIKQFPTEAEGSYKSATGIVAHSGSLWVAGEGDNIKQYSETGTVLSKFGPGTGSIGPRSLTFDSKGNIWVVEPKETGETVKEFPSTGETVREPTRVLNLGTVEKGNAIGADSEGNVWIAAAQEKNARVQEFNANGEFVTQIGVDTPGPEKFGRIAGIAVTAGGDLWVSDKKSNALDKYVARGEGFLQKVTTAGTASATLKKPNGTAVDPTGNVWVADTENNCVDEYSSTGTLITQVGIEGTALGQFKAPRGVAADAEGHIWVADTGNGRLQELSTTGAVIRGAASEGTGAGQLKKPAAVAVDSVGNVWVSDTENSRIEEFSPKGQYIRQYHMGPAGFNLSKPEGIAIDSKGTVWVVAASENNVQGFSPTGGSMASFGKEGTGNGLFKTPSGLAITGETAYVVDRGNNRVQSFKLKSGTATEYLAQFGTLGTGNVQFKEAQGVALDKEGHVWVADSGNNRAEELSTAGVYTRQVTSGATSVLMKTPDGAATDSSGHVWVADTESNRVDEYSTSGAYINRFGTEGTGNLQFKKPQGVAIDKEGHVWLADTGNNRLEELSSTGTFMKTLGTEGTEGGKFKKPAALTFDSSGNIWIADTGNSRVQELSSAGTYLRQYSEGMEKVEGIAGDSNGDVWVTAAATTGRIIELSSTGTLIGSSGTVVTGTGNGQFKEPAGIAVSGEVAYVVDRGNRRVQEFKLNAATGERVYVGQFGTVGAGNGQLSVPQGAAVDKEGHVWVADSGNNRVQEFVAPAATPKASQVIYYSSGANGPYPSCGNHPEWANLVCQTQPAAQPQASAAPALPLTTVTYNLLDEQETEVETVGATTRTLTSGYDTAGRQTTATVTSSIGTTLPTVTFEYDSKTGLLIKKSTTVSEKTTSVTNVFNSLGQLTSYTDASGVKTTYEYEPERDARLTAVNDGKGMQTYTYDATTGAMKEMVDSQGATLIKFAMGYDADGRMTSETYPNGMVAKYTYDPSGEATHVEYEKTTHCSEKCVWYSQTIVPSPFGETLNNTSTLTTNNYAYDVLGRLTQVEETPAGGTCKTRLYAYDEESNRTALTSREPDSEGKCATTGGAVQTHSYDEANRLIDAGIAYETFGEIAKLPEGDAEKQEVVSKYYVSGQLESQTQGEQTLSYKLDPTGRVSETISTGKPNNTTAVSHYADEGNSVTWFGEPSEKWTRNITGIDGTLVAVQNSEGTTLQLHDLEGDVVARAALSETETKLLSTYNSTEFGVPVNGPAPKYSWLGVAGMATERPSGISNGSTMSYIPQLGGTLQTEPVIPPGAQENGTYDGPAYITKQASWGSATDAAWAAGGDEREAARLKAAFEEALRKAGEGEDPTVYLTAYDATRIASHLEKVNFFAEIAEELGSVGESAIKIVEGIILDKFNGIEGIKNWYKETAEKLRVCAKDIEKGGESAELKQTCREETKDYHLTVLFFIKLTFENFTYEAKISWCTIGRKYCYLVKTPYKIPVEG
jgi:YD repeat-containing protein